MVDYRHDLGSRRQLSDEQIRDAVSSCLEKYGEVTDLGTTATGMDSFWLNQALAYDTEVIRRPIPSQPYPLTNDDGFTHVLP